MLAVPGADDDTIDVLIDLSGDQSAERPRAAPRVGVWRYGFGDGAHVAGGAPGTIARLYQEAGGRGAGTGTILHEGWFGRRTRESPGTVDVGSRVAGWAARA